MESALNLVWLGVSIALLVISGIYVVRAGDNRSRAMAAVALVCLVCFLFPVISMTDDLNCSRPALLEPSKLKKIMPSTLAVLTLLPWVVLQRPLERSWPAPESQHEIYLPLKEVLTFSLSRRPPPALPALA